MDGDTTRYENADKGMWMLNRDSMEDLQRGFVDGISWSGNERNHLFVGGLADNQFTDLAGISGIDDPADGRGFSLLDFDRDGWQDIALVNVSRPRLRLFRNTMGDERLDHGFIAFRFVGGNREPRPSREWSSRDGFGTSVELELSDTLTVYREHQPESSIKAQNSATLLVGLGTHDAVLAVSVRWLSGKQQTTTDIASGTLVTVYEDPSTSPTGEAFVLEPYRADQSRMTRLPRPEHWRTGLLPELPSADRFAVEDMAGGDTPTPARLRLYTTMATWCDACAVEMPEFRHLRDVFDEDELGMYGLPVDTSETAELLGRWNDRYDPPYELLVGLPPTEVDKVSQVVLSQLRISGDEAVPAAIVTDESGQVLLARWGVPTVSTLKRLLWLAEEQDRMVTASAQ